MGDDIRRKRSISFCMAGFSVFIMIHERARENTVGMRKHYGVGTSIMAKWVAFQVSIFIMGGLIDMRR